jgi:hypothetical protein
LLKAPDHNVKFLIQNSKFQIYYVPILTETYIGGCVHWDGWWLAKFGPLKAKKKEFKMQETQVFRSPNLILDPWPLCDPWRQHFDELKSL